ncbi:hypothetical protein [Serinibacter arcticus]|uniref:PH domain-containing protein n=1 Tax=Serinibacter arcticus TaxID=1655435 RepID=A0A4Z1E0K0_9MICO|nr:hypothetical protein [Serinibacter arcticus]TGO04598.1 hypothetical protein SERN_2191 [Serinibacter arcticus]
MTGDVDAPGEAVVARRRSFGPVEALGILPAVYFGSGVLASGGGRVLAAAAIAVALLGLSWLMRGFATHAVVVTPTALELRRRYRSVVVPRETVHRVRGSNAQRPEWSFRVFLDTDRGRVTIPDLSKPPVTEVLTQLQAWHADTAVDEQARD